MNNNPTGPQITWNTETKILNCNFSGHITKNEMVTIIDDMNSLLATISGKPINALHNFTHATHVSLDAQVIFAELSQSAWFKKHAFLSTNGQIHQTIDVIISITQENNDTMRIFTDESDAVTWLTK